MVTGFPHGLEDEADPGLSVEAANLVDDVSWSLDNDASRRLALAPDSQSRVLPVRGLTVIRSSTSEHRDRYDFIVLDTMRRMRWRHAVLSQYRIT